MSKTVTTPVSEKELSTLAQIYTQLQEPKRNIVVMGANLLLASQNAEFESKEKEQKENNRELTKV